MMSKAYDPSTGNVGEEDGRRKSSRKRFDTARNPDYGYSSGVFTMDHPPQAVGPVCRCSLLIVPEELERQWQRELTTKTDLSYRIVLTKSHVTTLRHHGEVMENITFDFPTPVECEALDVVVTTIERLGSRVGQRSGTSQNFSMQRMQDGLARVHWARIICDEGHELGGSGLAEMSKVLGAVLASATWVLSASPDRAGSGHFRQVNSQGMRDFLQPGTLGRESIVRTPKECIALPPLVCQVVKLPFSQPGPQFRPCQQCEFKTTLPICDACRCLPVEQKLVGRFHHIFNMDTQGLVEQAIDTTPEWTRLTNDDLLGASTGKGRFVVAAMNRKHHVKQQSDGHPPLSASQTGKSIVYSLYNSELYIALSLLRFAGWTDAGSPFSHNFDAL